jgi:hypothetical protein
LEGREVEVKFGSWKIGAVCALALSAAFVCQANVIYDFKIFNNDYWSSDKQLNFTVAISDEGQNKVGFLFENASLKNSSITAVYFDTGSLFKSAEKIIGSSGVSFSATAKSLPAGGELKPAFPKKPFFAADADSPPPKNGINPGEWLKIIFALNAKESFDSLIKQITTGSSRIGLHIQSLPDGSSVSAINDTTVKPPAIPEPATIALLAFGSIAFFRKTR